MDTSDQRQKGKCEELVVASSGSKKLSALRFVISPKKMNTPAEAVSGFEILDDPASISHSSQQINPVNPPTSDVDVVTV